MSISSQQKRQGFFSYNYKFSQATWEKKCFHWQKALKQNFQNVLTKTKTTKKPPPSHQISVQPPQFITDVVKALMTDNIKDNLSGGELQRVALALCLGKPADVYLINEPSAYLNSQQRIVAAKVITRGIISFLSFKEEVCGNF